VEVISGTSKVEWQILEVLPSKQRVLVEGVRLLKKHLRKSEDNPQGKTPSAKADSHLEM